MSEQYYDIEKLSARAWIVWDVTVEHEDDVGSAVECCSSPIQVSQKAARLHVAQHQANPAPCAICLSPWPKHQESCLVGQNETLKAERDAERARADAAESAAREYADRLAEEGLL